MKGASYARDEAADTGSWKRDGRDRTRRRSVRLVCGLSVSSRNPSWRGRRGDGASLENDSGPAGDELDAPADRDEHCATWMIAVDVGVRQVEKPVSRYENR